MIVISSIYRKIRKFIGENILKYRFPYLYAHYYYWYYRRKSLSYKNPVNFEEKLFWLARYWQDPRIVQCVDKLAVREYVKECELGNILNEIYAVYDSPNDIDISKLPDRFVLKTNHAGGGEGVIFVKTRRSLMWVQQLMG